MASASSAVLDTSHQVNVRETREERLRRRQRAAPRRLGSTHRSSLGDAVVTALTAMPPFWGVEAPTFHPITRIRRPAVQDGFARCARR